MYNNACRVAVYCMTLKSGGRRLFRSHLFKLLQVLNDFEDDGGHEKVSRTN